MSKMFLNISTIIILIFSATCSPSIHVSNENFDVSIPIHKKQIIANANQFLKQSPTPITQFQCSRSKGTIHDFYSEGDYWWPNPKDPDGPYIRKDGMTNPQNFTAHRLAMRNLNKWVSTLVAAYIISGDKKYALHSIQHLKAFFIDPTTKMNPSLLFAQAIKGKVTGRGIGIIDTIHLIEVAKAIEILIQKNILDIKTEKSLKKWFNDYAQWMNTHPYGIKEKTHGNNHSTWWAAQLAAFAHLAQRPDLMDVARTQFKKLLATQMNEKGQFPDELKRSKPYNYTLFNLEGYAVLCQIASTPNDNLWKYQSKNGSIKKAWDFMMPFIKNKQNWTYPPDVQHFDELPIQSPGLLFAAIKYKNKNYLDIWNHLSPIRKSKEINRNFPIREPILWTIRF